MTTFVITEGESEYSESGEQDIPSSSLCPVTYGIAIISGGKYRRIDDITTDREKIEYIVNTFNSEQPEPIHIEEILENFLLDFTDF